MEGISLGSAFLRLYGDRSALDRELEKLKRYTDYLEKQGIKVKFDADTGKATREIDGLQSRLNQLQQALGQVGDGIRGDEGAWKNLAENLTGLASKAANSGGTMGKMAGMLGTAGAAATKAIPILGQLGMAAMGLQAIFQGVSGAINGVIGPLAALSQEAGRFNQQVAEASIFAANSFAVYGPDGKAIQGTANQMRALRGTITKEYREIQKEVAQISGATASEIYEGFNIILQNVGSLGKEGEDLGNVRKLATRLAAGMNTLGVPGDQLRSEMYSLLTGDVQIYDKLGRDLYGADAAQTIKKLQAEGKYYDDLMEKLGKLYDGQKVLSESLTNVQSNFQDVFETIGAEASQSLERGLAKSFKAVLNPLDQLQGSFMGFARGTNEFLEPVLRILGEIGGWFVSVGSAIASTLQVVMDVLALGANIIGSTLGPGLRAVGKVLTIVAKLFELVAASVSSLLRPLTVFFRITGDQNNQGVDNAFDPIIDALDTLIGYAENAATVIAKPFIEAAKARAWLLGKLSGKSDEQIKGEQDEVEAEFGAALGQSGAPTLRSLKLLAPTEALLRELSERYGSGDNRQLQIAKETSQLVQDRLKNEITGTEQVIKLLQTQKSLQETMNQLADARRGITMSRAGFAVQVAASPEARLEAEERKNELAARQEQERIQERKALLGTERQLLQLQLQIQLRQQTIQQEQLKIQRAELQIQRNRAETAARDVATKINNAAPGSKERAALMEQWRLLGREIQLRDEQMKIMNRSVSLSFEAASGLRQTNALEQQRLGIQSQVLDVQGQAANLSLEQQQILSGLQRQEQELKNQLADALRKRNDLIKAAEQEIKTLQQQEKTQRQLQELERTRYENRKAAADAEVQAAEQQLKVAQARDGAVTGRDFLAAQIEAIATGTKGYISEAEATRKLYDAKERQLAIEQSMQRENLRIQQEREQSELRIAAIQLSILEQQTLNLQTELQIKRQQLGLQQQRDAISGSVVQQIGSANVVTRAGANIPPELLQRAIQQAGGQVTPPAAPNLPAAALAPGQSSIPAGARTNRTRDPDGEATGWDIVMPGGRGAPVRAPVDLTITGTGFQGSGAGSSGKGYGNWISGEFQMGGKSYELLLGHFDRVDVAPGMQVPAGTQLGSQGITGRTFGTHVTTHVNPKGGASVADAWNALDAVTRIWERGKAIAPGQAAASVSAATGGTTPTSLENDLLQNSNDLVQAETDLARIRREQVELQTQEAQLKERQSIAMGTLNTTQASQISQLQVDRLRAQLTAEVLNSVKGRLAVGVADAFVEGMTNATKGIFTALRNGSSITDAVNSALEQMADRVMDTILNAALKPLQDALYENILGGLLGKDLKQKKDQALAAQQQAAQQPTKQTDQAAGQSLQTAGQSLQTAAQNLQTAAQSLTAAAGIPATGNPVAPATPPATGETPAVTLPDPPSSTTQTPAANTTINAEGVQEQLNATEKSTATLNANVQKASENTKDADPKTKELVGSLGAAAGAVAGLGMMVAGVQGMKEGGTYNTLMGIAAVFGGIASITGSFASLGKRAAGGPVSAKTPYLVGERGPELFVPKTPGTVIPNGRTAALQAAHASTPAAMTGRGSFPAMLNTQRQGEALGDPYAATTRTLESVASNRSARMGNPGPIKVETTVINNVEYATVAQLQDATRTAEQRGAERGRAMTMNSLQNSLRARKKVGMS